MAILNQKRILNLIPKVSAPVTIHVSQGDVGTQIEFTLVKGDEVFSNTGNLTASVHGVREDRANFGPFTCTLSGSKVTFPLHSEMTAVKGSALTEIVLVDNGGNKVGSANFGILVEESVFPLGVTYDNDVSVYESILAYVQQMNSVISTEISARESADALINTRIDEIIAPTGEAPNPAEIVDARIGEDGTVHETLGSAIRTQIGSLKSEISSKPFYLINNADVSENTKNKIKNSLFSFCVVCKNPQITNIYINRMYCNYSGGMRSFSLKYTIDGEERGISYGFDGDQTGITIEKILRENDDIAFYALIDWSIAGNIITSNMTYQKTGINPNYIKYKSDYKMDDIMLLNPSYIVESANMRESTRNLIDASILSLNVVLKKEGISKVYLNRMYCDYSGGMRSFSLRYTINGEERGLSYAVTGSQTGVTTENFVEENDDIAYYAYIDWEAAGRIIVSNMTYERTGINDHYITPYSVYRMHFISSSITSNMCCNLIVCGYDAPQYAKDIAQFMANMGYGYVCNASELDSGINSFIDSFMNEPKTIYFYGTIRTSEGIHKHPKHNLYGYDCTLKMGDHLGQSYISCIHPLTGGITFEQQQVVSHNHTFVKGFVLDGNCENNKTDDEYDFKRIYGGLISGGLYNEETSPYSRTQLCSDIVLEDIRGINSMRGIVPSIGWVCRNLFIGDAVTDHALYIAGADGCIVDNCKITGKHNGALHISGQSWDANRQVMNIRLHNISLIECDDSDSSIFIRGHFSNLGNDYPVENVFIENLYYKKTNARLGIIPFYIGMDSNNEIGTMNQANYIQNVKISNMVVDVDLYNTLFTINNAGVKFDNLRINLKGYRSDRVLFRIQSNEYIKNAINFERLRVVYDGIENTDPWTFIGISNKVATHNELNGLIFTDCLIDGLSNYYLIGRSGSDTYPFTIKNLVLDKVIANPIAKIDPSVSQIITIAPNDYYT